MSGGCPGSATSASPSAAAGSGVAASGAIRRTCSRRTSRIFGTHTMTEIRRVLTCETMSTGLNPRMKTTTPPSIGGTKVAMAWPNMWLSGRRLRNRIGENGRLHLRYFSTSRSTGTMLARTLRWVMTTPLGSAVAPDVKMISATSSRTTATGGGAGRLRAGPLHLVKQPDRRRVRRRRRGQRRHVLADEHELGRHDAADAKEEVGGRPVVDRHDDDAAEQAAPERRDPLRAVLAPEDDGVALAESGLVDARGEGARHEGNCPVRVGPAPEPVVVHAGSHRESTREVLEKIEEGFASHE